MPEAIHDDTAARGGSPDAGLLHLLGQEAELWEAAKAAADDAECDRLTERAHGIAARALAQPPRTAREAEAIIRHAVRSLRSGGRADGLDLAALGNVADFLADGVTPEEPRWALWAVADGADEATRALNGTAFAGAMVLDHVCAAAAEGTLGGAERDGLAWMAEQLRDAAENVAAFRLGRAPRWQTAKPEPVRESLAAQQDQDADALTTR